MKRMLPLALLLTGGACAGTAPPPAPSAAIAPDAIALRPGWRSTVIAERDDSIVLTLPSGDRQLQRIHRVATFTLSTGPTGAVSTHLDSVRSEPSGGGAPELASLVQQLVPRLPASGARPNSSWSDSARGPTSIDIFKVTERRNAAWTSGALTRAAGGQTLPIRLREEFEQIGSGSRDDQRLTYTSQGRRTGTYYLNSSGRLTSAQLRDSSTISIGVPASKALMSGTRVTRTEIRFVPVRE